MEAVALRIDIAIAYLECYNPCLLFVFCSQEEGIIRDLLEIGKQNAVQMVTLVLEDDGRESLHRLARILQG